jgi:beta-lactamase superfamily II metal-dependent hydrolase
VKSFAVGNGDSYYIRHGSDSFTIIDCNLAQENIERIVEEIEVQKRDKSISRFISTHPDEDHIRGLSYLDQESSIVNFYCVENEATKEEETVDFMKYCELRDSDKAFNLYAGCSRKWLNKTDDERGSAGITILWPDVENERYKEELEKARKGISFNNISAIIKYSMNDGVAALWMGDLETDFMEAIKHDVDWPTLDILFMPHHGRDSGRLPQKILDALEPSLLVLGEAPSEHLDYPAGYDKITQNSSGDITFQCETGKVHVYVSNPNYSVTFLDDENMTAFDNYIGTLQV